MRPVEIEVLLLRALPGAGLAFRVVRRPLDDDAAPDAAALRLAGLLTADGGPAWPPAARRAGGATQAGGPGRVADLPAAGAVCHSTSWRHDDGTVVLTYAALPDPRPGLPAAPLDAPAVLCSDDPLRPAPAGLHGHHVAAHAVRHLAYLAGHDPVVARAAAEDRTGVWPAVLGSALGMPAGTHAELLAAGHVHGRFVPAAVPAAAAGA